jgi:predicted deacylase
MLGSIVAALVATYGGGAVWGFLRRDLEWSPYPSPDEARQQMEHLPVRYPEICTSEIIGQSTEGRPILALRFRGRHTSAEQRPRLLISAQIHAVEYIGAYVAREVAHRLAEGYGGEPAPTALLDRADIWIVPLLNPDGAARVWRRAGWSTLGASRFTANGVDPNRNFPYVSTPGRKGWNSGSDRPGSAYYRGPHPLSEPECRALARLCKREGFCAAINFHSFGGVVFMPEIHGPDREKAAHALDVFKEVFQSHQPHVRYRPVPERSAKILGQLDPFLLNGLGAPSVTVEVSRPSAHVLLPWHTFNAFWWANPARPERWAANDAGATLHALAALLERTGGTPCVPAVPALAGQVLD